MRWMGRWVVVGAVAIFATGGCEADWGINDILGTWAVLTVNGDAVPGPVELASNVTIYIEYEHWTFMDGGQCSITGEYDGVVQTFDACEHVVNVEENTIVIALAGTFDVHGSIDRSPVLMTLTTEDSDVIVLQRHS